MDRLVVVGSGTVVPEGDRGCSSYFVELGAARILLDCGPGAVQGLARFGLPWQALTDLVLTHFHGDHVGALPGLFFALRHGIPPPGRSRALRVWGPPGTRRLFRGLASALGDYLLDPGFPVSVREVEAGDGGTLEAGVLLRTHPTPHTQESQAVRLDAARASIGYTGDTGPDETLGAFMEGVEALVCECSLADDEVGDNHLSPSRVARIAAAARPGRLLLTHVYPHLRAARDPDVMERVRAAGYEGRVELAFDGMTLALGEERPSPGG